MRTPAQTVTCFASWSSAIDRKDQPTLTLRRHVGVERQLAREAAQPVRVGGTGGA